MPIVAPGNLQTPADAEMALQKGLRGRCSCSWISLRPNQVRAVGSWSWISLWPNQVRAVCVSLWPNQVRAISLRRRLLLFFGDAMFPYGYARIALQRYPSAEMGIEKSGAWKGGGISWKPQARGIVLPRGTSERAKGQREPASCKKWQRLWLAGRVSCGTTCGLERRDGSG